METNKAAPPTSPMPAAPPKPTSGGSPVRLLILLGLLLLVVGAYAYDFFVLRPGVDEGYKRIQSLVDERNKQGVQKSQLVTSTDVQQLLGRKPNRTVDNKEHDWTVEYYYWWGNVPVINRRRHFIAVVYTGKEPRHFSSHYQEEPPPEAYPNIPEVPKEEPGKKTTDGDGKLPPPNGVSGGGDPPAGAKPADAKSTDAKETAPTPPPAGEKPAADASKNNP